MKNSKRTIVITLLAGIVLGVVLCSIISALKYDMDWMIGKHYEEIISRYGEFDYGNSKSIPYKNKFKGPYSSVRQEVDLDFDNVAAYIYYNWIERTYDPTGEGEEFPLIVIEFDSEGYAICVSKGYAIPLGG